MNMRIVLCPIDFSTLADREVDLAVQVCEAVGGRLVLHHNLSAISPGFAKAWEWDEAHQSDQRSAVDAERGVADLLKRLPAAVHAEAVVSHGPLARVVLALAQELPADLLVLGTHGWSTEDHASVTERIIEHSPCPVLTIRDAVSLETFRLRRQPGEKYPLVVVATDFSKSGDTAVAYACWLARMLPARLHLLHVSPSAKVDEALKALDQLVPAEWRDRTECHVRVGQADTEIERYLAATAPDLIVMGTHARGVWRRFFTRDTAGQLLHHATCPVCFVPPKVQP
jgi:nucleotide-binding universal stress UspA family protein